jgi:hypothetical protein
MNVSVFLPRPVIRAGSTTVLAACRTAVVTVLAGLDVVTGIAVNSGMDAEVREPWSRYLISALAFVVCAALTVVLIVGARWAGAATVMACGALLALTLVELVIDMGMLAAGAAPGIDLAWHVPFRGTVAVLNLLLYVTIMVVLTWPTEPMLVAQERSDEPA